MIVVYKYPMLEVNTQIIDLPKDASVLHIDEQFGRISMWCEIDTEVGLEPRTFHIYGTGHTIANREGLSFLQTIVVAGGTFVWHIFEERNQ